MKTKVFILSLDVRTNTQYKDFKDTIKSVPSLVFSPENTHTYTHAHSLPLTNSPTHLPFPHEHSLQQDCCHGKVAKH